MLLVLIEGFCLNAQEGYRSLFFKDAGYCSSIQNDSGDI